MTFEENIGKTCIINSKAVPFENLNLYTDDRYTAFYEVIRIIKGVPLFYEEHFARLKNSLKKAGYELSMSKKDLKDQISEVCRINSYTDCNVKVMVMQDGAEQAELLFINKFYYPVDEEFAKGVDCCTIMLKRSNPNIKMIHSGYREEIKRVSEEKKVFEVLLVNENDKITEGGKSNVFFVKGNRIYTSPGDYVLMGITRQYVIDVCIKLGYEVIETLIGLSSLNDFDACFLTGTSIKVLPVRKIDDILLNSAQNTVTQHILSSYNTLLADYVKNN